MKEYQALIKEYASEAYLSFNQIVAPESEWGNKKKAEVYLEKYWLPKEEYKKYWKPIQDKIFINQDNGLPELIFSEHYQMIALNGGCLFVEDDFKRLQNCFLKVGDSHFVIIENSFGGEIRGTPLRMKYPSNISWKELTSGNFISSTIVDNSMKEYFVFSQSASWGKYAANDAINPMDIIGFKTEYSPIFVKNFQQTNDEWEQIKGWLPSKYRKRMKI